MSINTLRAALEKVTTQEGRDELAASGRAYADRLQADLGGETVTVPSGFLSIAVQMAAFALTENPTKGGPQELAILMRLAETLPEAQGRDQVIGNVTRAAQKMALVRAMASLRRPEAA